MQRNLSVLILTLFIALNAFSASAKELRYANFPPASTFPSMQMDTWVKEITKATNGKVSVQTFPASTLLDVKAMLRGVARGQADIGCMSMLYYPGSFPLFELFGLPLGFSSASEASFVAWELFKIHKPKELGRYKVLSIFSSAPSQIMSTKPVENLEDLKKITLRSSGSISDALTAIGGKAVSIPMSETPEALQKGVVEGVCSSWDTLYDMNFAQDCKYGLTVDMPVYPFAVIMNKKTWESLPAQVQKAIDDYADEHVEFTGNLVDNAGKKAINWAIEEHGFALSTINSEDSAKIKIATSPLIEKWKKNAIDKGLDADKILADIEKLRTIYLNKNK